MGIMKEIKLYDVVIYAGYEWFVIEIDNDKVTLLAKNNTFGTCCFDKDSNEYKTSEIRRYINTVVLNKLTENGAYLETVPIQDLEDKIFLLSVDEAKKLPTKVRKFKRCWWLRSLGLSSHDSAYVSHDGNVYPYGIYIDFDPISIRPAITVKANDLLKSLELEPNMIKE